MEISGIKFEPLADRPGWFVSKAAISDVDDTTANNINQRGGCKSHYAVCGWLPEDEGYKFYLVPAGDPLRLIRDFEIGSHNADDWSKTLEILVKEVRVIHAANPIIPFFADAAGFKFSFENPITDGLVELIESTATEGIEGLANIRDDKGGISDGLKLRGFLHLWWD